MAACEAEMPDISGVDAFLDLSRSQQGLRAQAGQPLPPGYFMAAAGYNMQADPTLSTVSTLNSMNNV
jgi:hypothetical protein